MHITGVLLQGLIYSMSCDYPMLDTNVIKQTFFRIHVVTYNVATIFPNARLNLSRLLGLENDPDENSRPDIYVIG